MHRLKNIILAVTFFSTCLIVPLFAADQKADEKAGASKEKADLSDTAKSGEAAKKQKELTKEELLKEISMMLGRSGNILGALPGVEAVKSEDGTVNYLFKKEDGKKIPLSELDETTLRSIYVKARNAITRINMENTLRQMKEIRRIEEMNRQARALRSVQPQNINTYKPTYTPPQIPKAPKLPPPQPKR